LEFIGFTDEQFKVFELAGFTERMVGIRTTVRPVLQQLGADLAGPLSRLAGEPLFAHVAMHTRRRVNPPDDTWVAFARSRRGYKASAHFEIGLSRDGVFVGLVLKDESDDRAPLGRYILDDPDRMVDLAQKLKSYQFDELKGVRLAHATAEDFRKLGEALVERKTSSFHLYREIRRTDRRVLDPEAVRKLAIDLARPIAPLYRAAVKGS
jgi:uncharacterized protein YktB (UPF0637 family)